MAGAPRETGFRPPVAAILVLVLFPSPTPGNADIATSRVAAWSRVGMRSSRWPQSYAAVASYAGQ